VLQLIARPRLRISSALGAPRPSALSIPCIHKVGTVTVLLLSIQFLVLVSPQVLLVSRVSAVHVMYCCAEPELSTKPGFSHRRPFKHDH
jgi:hypothetical protein